jgi:hypothetical protein
MKQSSPVPLSHSVDVLRKAFVRRMGVSSKEYA